MTLPVWTLVLGVLGSLGIGGIVVAIINGYNSLPAHLNTELVRLDKANQRAQERLDSLEAHQVLLGDHVDLLESHIWNQLPPPPPARPIFRPHRSDSE